MIKVVLEKNCVNLILYYGIRKSSPGFGFDDFRICLVWSIRLNIYIYSRFTFYDNNQTVENIFSYKNLNFNALKRIFM